MGDGSSYRDRTYGSRSRILRFAHTSRFDLARRLVGGLAGQGTDARILDFGAGDGHFLDMLRRDHVGTQLFGLDRYAEPSTIQDAIDAGQITWTRDPTELGDRVFDLICTFETLEHVPDETIDVFITLCNEHLAPGGFIVVSVPIEVGPPLVFKSLIRALMGSPRHLATPRNLVAGLFGRTERIPRATQGTQIGHVGFDHFRLKARFEVGLDASLVREHLSPTPYLAWWANSQVFWVFRRG